MVFIGRSSTAASWAFVTEPNAPNSTLPKERFIALLIGLDSRKPEAPSSAPQVMSTSLPIAKPVADAARPA